MTQIEVLESLRHQMWGPRRSALRRGEGDHAGGVLPAQGVHFQRGARRGTAGTGGPGSVHQGRLVHHGQPDPAGRRAGRSRSSPGPCMPPNMPPSDFCRWWHPATAGTSAASPPPSMRTPASRPSLSTTAIPAVPVSPSVASTRPGCGSRRPGTPSPPANASPAARPASSLPNAATRTTLWTRPERVTLIDILLDGADQGERAAGQPAAATAAESVPAVALR